MLPFLFLGKENILKKALLFSISLFLTLAVGEWIFRRVTNFPQGKTNKVPHPKLLYTMKTSKPQIDELGFRNPSLPKQAEIIALGDSFTYGYNVSSNNR